MKDEMRRKAQQKINTAVEELNKDILSDNVWKGRFVARQIVEDYNMTWKLWEEINKFIIEDSRV